MFATPVTKTALLTAAARAQEDKRADPLVHDPYAKNLAGEEGERLLQRFGELFTVIEAVRTKFFDDTICAEISDRGIRQVVMLGAGLDTRPYRLRCLNQEILWFEIDYESVFRYKRNILQNAKPLCKVTDVAQDMRDPDFVERLTDNGLNLGLTVLWVAEGFFQYLKEAEVNQILDRLHAYSPAGSEIVFNAQNRAVLTRPPYNEKMLDFLREMGTPWMFTTESPSELLTKHGILKHEIIFLGHTKAHYGRLPWPASDSPPKEFPVEWLARGIIGART